MEAPGSGRLNMRHRKRLQSSALDLGAATIETSIPFATQTA
jgi:hypothetical protein